MARVLVEYRGVVRSPAGETYGARACGRRASDGRWDGWVEFVAVGSGRVIRSPRETVQPNRVDLEYWAGGLGPIYLEGCLQRALESSKAPRRVRRRASPSPAFDEPAPRHPVDAPAPGEPARLREALGAPAILDPFELHATGGVDALRHRLTALADGHLRNIARAYRIVAPLEADALDGPELSARIIAACIKAAAAPGR